MDCGLLLFVEEINKKSVVECLLDQKKVTKKNMLS